MPDTTSAPDLVRSTVEEVVEEYNQGADQPLAQYTATLATYGASIAGLGFFIWSKRRGRLPDFGPTEMGLFGVATFKLARVISKDAVTSPLRAPFTQFEGDADTPAEVQEKPRGTGVRKTLGELLSCPFCLSQWVGTGFAVAYVLAPRATKIVAGTLGAITTADFLQFAYVAAEKRT
jgi:hypothetical protein